MKQLSVILYNEEHIIIEFCHRPMDILRYWTYRNFTHDDFSFEEIVERFNIPELDF